MNHKNPSTSTVARRSYAAALKTGHASGVHSEGIGESDLQITPQNQFVAMHNSLKEMDTRLVELKAMIAFLSTKIESGLFEVGSTSGIGVETSVMKCHSPQVTFVPEETMAPSSELKENGVIPLVKGPAEVAHKGSPEVKGLDVIPLERTNGVRRYGI